MIDSRLTAQIAKAINARLDSPFSVESELDSLTSDDLDTLDQIEREAYIPNVNGVGIEDGSWADFSNSELIPFELLQ